ncbi:lamin tail domain-containing protein [Geitlerinema sp. CS-897]|nr:lamin tail domain-containing protein [Geitlerinema sp. CS-897]
MSDLLISEYIEGSGYNKALELYNPTSVLIDLASGNYSLDVYFNGDTTPTQTLNLTGEIAPDDVFVLAHGSANPAILSVADLTNDFVINFNGNDTIVLNKNGNILDSFGKIGENPGNSWGSGDTASQNRTLRRQAGIYNGDSDASDSFDPAVEWVGFNEDTTDGLGFHAATIPDTPPSVFATTPFNNETGVAIASDLTIQFDEAVTVSGNWFSIVGDSSGNHTASFSGSGSQYSLDPDDDFHPGEAVTVTVFAANIADIDSTPDSPIADYSFSFEIATSGDVIFNEILADPDGDANGDGVTDSSEDEFIEFLNNAGSAIDFSGWELSDGVGVRHVFPPGTILAGGEAIVVFGGGTPTGSFGDAIVQTASTGLLGLNNSGDTLTLNDGSQDVATYTYGSEGGDNQSLTRSPDVTGGFVKHGTLGSSKFSPGTQTDGSSFPLDVTPPSLAATTPLDNASDVGRNLDLTIRFDEAVVKGTGSIAVRRSSDDAVVEAIAVSSSQVVVSGDTVTVGLANSLDFSTGYEVRIDNTAFEDLAGNPFSGIDDATTWNFTTTAKPGNSGSSGNSGNSGNSEEEEKSSSKTASPSEDVPEASPSETPSIAIPETSPLYPPANHTESYEGCVKFNINAVSSETGSFGNDLMFGDAEANEILGGSGNDTLVGWETGDDLDGGDGEDWLFGNRGNDDLEGNRGSDRIFAGKDGDRVSGGDGDDAIAGELGDDCLLGEVGNDVLLGNAGSDRIWGGDDSDSLFGGKDNDELFGDGGDDFLSGDWGDDTLTGGGGSDRFILGFGKETIADFTDGVDRLVLGNSLTLSQLQVFQVETTTEIQLGDEVVAVLLGESVDAIDVTDFETGFEI